MATGLAPVLAYQPTADDFATDPNGPANATLWTNLTGDAAFIPAPAGSDYKGTEMALPGGGLPDVEDGALRLTLQTYENANTPSGLNAFQGSQVVSKQSFGSPVPGLGYAFTTVAKFDSPPPSGIDGGMFTYGLAPTPASSTNHNELDFEALSDIVNTQNNQVQTNIYVNQSTNVPGAPLQASTPSLTSYQTYTVEWFPGAVLWFVNGVMVRQSTSVPDAPMQFYLNIWASDATGTSLLPTASQSASQTYTFDVRMADVATIADVNSTLTIDGTTANQDISDTASLPPFAKAAVTDDNPGATDMVTVTLSDPASGGLSNLDGGTYNASTGIYIVSGTAAAVTTALSGLVFQPARDQALAGQSVTTTFTIAITDTADASAYDGTTSVVATETSPTYGLVQAAELGILRTTPGAAAISQEARQIDSGSLKLSDLETSLIDGEQTLYTTLPALVTIDAMYDATPSSSTLTAVATAMSGVAYYTGAGLHALGYSDPNVWTIMGSEWSADPTSNFYALYQADGASYGTIISAVYQTEFGYAPSAQNLLNLINDVPGVQALLAGGGGQSAATPIQVAGGIYGYLLYVGQADGIGRYAAAADAFLRAAANGSVSYGPELTKAFPPGGAADTSNVITVSNSDQLIDPGTGNHTIQFLAGTGAETLVLRSGEMDQVSGFNPGTDTLDFSSPLSGTGIDLIGDLTWLANHITVSDQAGSAVIAFDPNGQGGGTAEAVLQGLGNTIRDVGTLLADNAVRIV